MRGVACRVALAVAFSAVVAVRPLRADDDPATKEARAHFRTGVELYDRHQFAAALEEFRDADRDKPTPGIKRNIALCLKALGRYPEAMDALEDMLSEAGASLDPDVRASARKTLDELADRVGTVRVILLPRGAEETTFTVTLDGTPLSPPTLGRPIRVLPGAHTVRATAQGYRDAEQAVTVSAGAAVDVSLAPELVEVRALGRLEVRAHPSSAEIAIDGVVLARGGWAGQVALGRHRIDVQADGYVPFVTEIPIEKNEARTVETTLEARPFAPPPRREPGRARLPRWYVAPGVSGEAESLSLASAGFGIAGRHAFGGAAFEAKVGRRLGRAWAVQVTGELGEMTSTFAGATLASRVSVTNWSVAPELVLQSQGSVRAAGGVAFGLEGQVTDAAVQVGNATGTTEVRGAGVAPVGLLELGLEYGAHHFLFAASAFGDVHGVSANSASGARLYEGTAVVRVGARAFVGYQF